MSIYQSVYTGAQIDSLLGAVNTAVTADGIVNINGLNTILGDYLTSADATNTYLTQADAASTYLTKSDAASTYQTQLTFDNNIVANSTNPVTSGALYDIINPIGTVLSITNKSVTKTSASSVDFPNLLTLTPGTWIIICHCTMYPTTTSNNYVQLHLYNTSDDGWGNGGNGGDWSSGECEVTGWCQTTTNRNIGVTMWSTYGCSSAVINKLSAIRIR